MSTESAVPSSLSASGFPSTVTFTALRSAPEASFTSKAIVGWALSRSSRRLVQSSRTIAGHAGSAQARSCSLADISLPSRRSSCARPLAAMHWSFVTSARAGVDARKATRLVVAAKRDRGVTTAILRSERQLRRQGSPHHSTGHSRCTSARTARNWGRIHLHSFRRRKHTGTSSRSPNRHLNCRSSMSSPPANPARRTSHLPCPQTSSLGETPFWPQKDVFLELAKQMTKDSRILRG